MDINTKLLSEYYIRINNRKNFLLTEIPNYHPASKNYLLFWREQRRRVIEGFWAPDDKNIIYNVDDINPTAESTQWRWSPPQLYFYGNFGTILHNPPNTSPTDPKIPMRPIIRDVEWEIYYDIAEARGFSGFENDEEYTSCELVIDSTIDESMYHESCFNKQGQVKKYVPVSKYLRKLHTKKLGKALYRNGAKNYILLSTRELGKSFSIGGGILAHAVINDGRKDYVLNEQLPRAEMFVGSGMGSKSYDLMKKVELTVNHLPGAWKKGTPYEEPCPFYKAMSGSIKPGKEWIHQYDKKINGEWRKGEGGTKTSIKHVPFTIENPEAAAGGRYIYTVIEEVGLTSNVLTIISSNEAAQQKGIYQMGTSILIGTGGNIEKIVESEAIFKEPKIFNFLEFDDIWENTGKIGRFFPALLKDNEFKDENGNTNFEKALKYYKKRREEKKKSKNSKALDGEMMNYPLVPSEMFLSSSRNRFPIAELNARLAKLLSSKFIDSSYKGHFTLETGKVIFNALENVKPIRDFPIGKHKDINLTGCVEIFEHPRKVGEEIPSGRYLAGMDPIDDDDNNNSNRSLQSFFIIDTWEKNKIVLEYSARTKNVKDFYEQVRRALIYYKATLLYENQKKGLFGYFDYKNSLFLLADTPEFLKDVDLQRPGSGNRAKGVYATGPINNFGLELIETQLEEKAYGADENNELIYIDTIKSIGLLRELTKFNGEINCDRVSSLGIALIYAESLKKRTEKRKEKIKQKSQDPFFQRHIKISYNPQRKMINHDVN